VGRSSRGLVLSTCLVAFALVVGCTPLLVPSGTSGGGSATTTSTTTTTVRLTTTTTAAPTTTTAPTTTVAPTTTAAPTTTVAPTTTTTAAPTTTTTAPRTASGFVHPGVVVDRAQLDLTRSRIAAGAEPWASAFQRLQSSGTSRKTALRPTAYRFSSLDYVPAPVAVVADPGSSGAAYIAAHPELGLKESGSVEHIDDSMAAYAHALMWAYTGNEAHARKSAQILNAWSATLTEIKFDQPRRIDNNSQVFVNGKLQAGWAASLTTRAAEIIRYTWNGWSATDATRYENLLKRVYLPLTISSWSNQSNWLMTLAEATIGIGVFTNDRATFDTAVSQWRSKVPTSIYLTSDGPLPVPANSTLNTADKLRAYWYYPSTWVNGLQQESLRDLSHMAMGMGAMSNAAETARIQGVDLYAEQRTRLVTAYELQAGYANAYLDEVARLGGAQPASTWKPPGWVGSSFKVGGTAFRTGWEVAHSHYARRLGVSMPQTTKLVHRLRPSGIGMHLSWETLSHAR
jgi:hypothetical protein